MSTPEQAVQDYASLHYGHLILVDDPIFVESEGVYVSRLRSDYPFVIKDDKLPQKKSLHVLKIDNLGCITVDKDSKIVREQTTPRYECVQNLDLFFAMWKKRAEEIVVAASADNLVKISIYLHFLDPIDSILVSLWEYNRIHNAEVNIERNPLRQKKMRLYLGLLEGLEVLRKVDKGYEEGNLALSLKNEIKKNPPKHQPNEEYFRDAIISTIFRERYRTLRDVFRLTIFEPTIHIDNCIYLPEMEIEKPVFRNTESIAHDYSKYYHRRINIMDLRLILRRLENADAIKRDGEHYYGNAKLLKEMVRLKKEAPSPNKELLVRA
jgi:hypothetical protein